MVDNVIGSVEIAIMFRWFCAFGHLPDFLDGQSGLSAKAGYFKVPNTVVVPYFGNKVGLSALCRLEVGVARWRECEGEVLGSLGLRPARRGESCWLRRLH